jgi:DNA-directed RNA polymerase subunit D
MKIKVSDMKPKKAVIEFEDSDPYFVNSIRRVMLAELPKLAIDDVVIYDNTSALFDEIISHRLGLVPIPTDLDLLSFRQDCVCKDKGCPNCTVRYTLSKEGDGTDMRVVVYSGDLQPAEKSWAITEGNIPIVELYKEQRLILEVEAVLGCGRDHAKWQSVVSPGYRFYPAVEIDKKRINDVKDFINEIPDGVVKLKGDKLEIEDISQLPILESYIDKFNVDFITVKRDSSHIIFSFETDGSLTAEDALYRSAKILEDKYSEFGKLLKKI